MWVLAPVSRGDFLPRDPDGFVEEEKAGCWCWDHDCYRVGRALVILEGAVPNNIRRGWGYSLILLEGEGGYSLVVLEGDGGIPL